MSQTISPGATTTPHERYEAWAKSYDDRTSRFNWSAPDYLLKAVLGHALPKGNLRVLDIGVGTGQASVPYLEAGASVTGIDISQKMLEAAKAKNPQFHALIEHDFNVPLSQAGLLKESFDLVISCGALHFATDLQETLSQLRWVIANSGILAFTYIPPQQRDFSQATQPHNPADIERILEQFEFKVLEHQPFLAYYDNGDSNDPVYYQLIVAGCTREKDNLLESLVNIDRTACVDRSKIVSVVNQPLMRGISQTQWSDDLEEVEKQNQFLVDTLRSQIDRGEIEPKKLPLPQVTATFSRQGIPETDILVLMPHPDDESIYAGGTIAALTAAGYKVRLVIATDGKGGRGAVNQRMEELYNAAEILNIERVESLELDDFGKYRNSARTIPITSADTLSKWGLDKTASLIVHQIRKHRPRILLTLHPEVDPNYSLHGHHLGLGVAAVVGYHLAADPKYILPDYPKLLPWAVDEHQTIIPDFSENSSARDIGVDAENQKNQIQKNTGLENSSARDIGTKNQNERIIIQKNSSARDIGTKNQNERIIIQKNSSARDIGVDIENQKNQIEKTTGLENPSARDIGTKNQNERIIIQENSSARDIGVDAENQKNQIQKTTGLENTSARDIGTKNQNERIIIQKNSSARDIGVDIENQKNQIQKTTGLENSSARDIDTENRIRKNTDLENPSARDIGVENRIRKIEINKELKLKAIQAHQTQQYSTQRLISFLKSDNSQSNFETIQILQRRCCSNLITAISLTSDERPHPVLSDTPLPQLLQRREPPQRTALLVKERGKNQNYSDNSLLNKENERSNTPLLNKERGRGEVKSESSKRNWNSTYNSIQQRNYPRRELSELLKQQTQTWGNSEQITANINKLQNPQTVTVVTGQQVGILGGPAYTLYKALGAIKLASILSEQDIPAVPVFWMASYDHDMEEVQQVKILNKRPEPEILNLDLPKTNRSVGSTNLGLTIDSLLDKTEQLLANLPYTQQISKVLRNIYQPETNFTKAFGRWLNYLTSEFGLIILDPNQPEFARLAKNIIAQELFHSDGTRTAFQRSRQILANTGQTEIIPTDRDVTQVFFTDNNRIRQRLIRVKGGFRLQQSNLFITKNTLQKVLERQPERFTPSALLRPLYQDTVLPTIAYIAGPTEQKYFKQLPEIYKWASIPIPEVVARPSFTVIDSATANILNQAGGTVNLLNCNSDANSQIGIAGLPKDIRLAYEELNKLQQQSFELLEIAKENQPLGNKPLKLQQDIENWFSTTAPIIQHWGKNRIDKVFNHASTEIYSLIGTVIKDLNRSGTPGNPPPLKNTSKLAQKLGNLQNNILREGRKQNNSAIVALTNINPNNSPQERNLSVAELIAKHGKSIISHLLRISEIDSSRKLVIENW